MPAGIFLESKDLITLEGLSSQKSAWRRYDVIRAAIGKTTGDSITINEYCAHAKVKVEEVLLVLFPKRKTA